MKTQLALAEPAGLSPAVERLANTINGVSHSNLTGPAWSVLKDWLERYGNILSREHQVALISGLQMCTEALQGELKGRWAFPIGTGMGKSSLIAAWCAVLSRLPEAAEHGVVVASYQVEANCQLVRMIEAMGGDASKVGIIHHYELCKASDLNAETGEPLPGVNLTKKKRASRPAIDPLEAHNYQVLLVTHNKIERNIESIVERVMGDFEFEGVKRPRFNLWDETLSRLKNLTVDLRDLCGEIGTIEGRLRYDRMAGKENKLQPLVDYYRNIEAICFKEMKRQGNGRRATETVLPAVDVAGLRDLVSFNRASKEVSASLADYLTTLLYFNSDGRKVRISSCGTNAILYYEPRVPDSLKNIIIFDASDPIADVTRRDPTITAADHPKRGRPDILSLGIELAKLKDCCDVHVEHVIAGGGYSTTLKKRAGAAIAEDTRKVIQREKYGKDDAFLIWVFKDRYDAKHKGRRPMSLEKRIRRDLKRNGIDLDATVKRTIGGVEVERPRINFAYWGQECNLNCWAYCNVVIIPCVIHLPKATLVGQYTATIDDLYVDMPEGTFGELRLDFIANKAFQAMSRGSMRIIVNGKALATDVFIVHAQPGLAEKLKSTVLWNSKWLPWYGRYKKETAEKRRPEYVEHDGRKLEAHLDKLHERTGVTKVSFKGLQKAAGLSLSKRRWQLVREWVVEFSNHWDIPKRGRSFVRV